MYEFWNKPLASPGFLSYRYRGRYGWIMIGAKNDADALREAARSTYEPIESKLLQKWNGSAYVDVSAS